ncbi:MAG: helix-turn-helix domain-containing protein [Empedobacter falsenii]
MKTVKFNKTECRVDFHVNVINGKKAKKDFSYKDVYDTDFFEIIFFTKANGTLYFNQEKLTISDNDIVFLSPFQKRQWLLDEKNLEMTCLIFQEQFLNDFFADKLFSYRLLYFYQLNHSVKLPLKQNEFQNFIHLLNEIQTEAKSVNKDSVHIIRSLLYYSLQKLNRLYAQKFQLPIENQQENIAFTFKKLLEQNIKQNLRITDYADKIGISRISLNKNIKKQFNVTASKMLHQRLLFEIQHYLIHTQLTVSQIADELNFSEPNHLMRFFKNQTGKTTSEFLSDYQNGSI